MGRRPDRRRDQRPPPVPTPWRPADGRVGWPGPPPRTGLLPLALLAALPYILSRLAGH